MIVCSCNVLSDKQVKALLAPGAAGPRTPAQVYRCLGCSPQCGRCAATIRDIMRSSFAEAAAAAVAGCTETNVHVCAGGCGCGCSCAGACACTSACEHEQEKAVA